MAEDPDRVVPARREGRRLRIPTPADLRHPRQDPGPVATEDAPPAQGTSTVRPPAVEQATPGKQATAADGLTPTPGNMPRPQPAPASSKAARPPDPGSDRAAPGLTEPGETEGGEPGKPADSPGRRLFPNPASLMAAGRGARKVRSSGFRGRRLPRVEETSAGGVVLDLTSSPPAVALIARHDRRSRLLWSLPKGHVEAGETPEQAALREVHEETGLVGRIVAPLGVIDFWFIVEDKRIHKTVHHFVIEAVGGELSDEDIEVEAVEWVPFDQVSRRLAYGDERRLVDKVAAIVPGVR